MTTDEIVARALRDHPEGLFAGPQELQRLMSESVARAVVAALTEVGRLLPDGYVAVPVETAKQDLAKARKEMRAWASVNATRLATDASREDLEAAQARVLALEIALEPTP